MELRHLRYFVTLAEELHFARAAARLHIVQPALSMQIKALEKELGSELFERSRRVVHLTPTGNALLPAARRCLKQAELARRAVADAMADDAGHVRIGYSASAVYSDILRTSLAVVRNARPNIEIFIEEIHPQSQIDALLERDLDVVLSTTLSVPDTTGLTQHVLRRYPLHLAMATYHPLAEQEAVSSAALAHEPFIGYTGDRDTAGSLLYQRVLGFQPEITGRAQSPLMMLGLVETGLGVAIVSSVLASRFRGEVVFRPIIGVDLEMDVALIHRDESPSNAVGFFIDTARQTAAATGD